MTTTIKLHTLDTLTMDFGGWYGECSCHNPDGNGVGRKDWHADTAGEVVEQFAIHQLETAVVVVSKKELARELLGADLSDRVDTDMEGVANLDELWKYALEETERIVPRMGWELVE